MIRAFKVDVPFTFLLDRRTTVGGLAELVAQGLLVAQDLAVKESGTS